MMIFAQEPYTSIPYVVEKLAHEHFEEAGIWQKTFKLNVNMKTYMNDKVRLFTMATEQDEIVAYAVFFVLDHHHMSGVEFAMNDALYMKEEYRKEYSADFLKFIESQLDVDVIQYSMNYTNAHGNFMRFHGYVPNEIVYHKVLV